ncbi:hypothetical protein [Halegenticoccus soli]|uniref:hypothetical protein n=1 Tax=Halegenticoccus soli TaxID=1985678 RepID=UPI000C6D488B|nr:hypothetical protein [Halegenticoccus soli]
MSARPPSADRSRLRRIDAESLGRRLLGAAFGDRVGLAVFLAAATFFGLYWRIGFSSTDNYALVNGLVALADGHLAIERIVYGPPTGTTPGTVTTGDHVYARSYGLLAASVPILWTLRAVSLVADVRVLVVGVWCLGALGLAALLGDRVGREREGLAVGSIVALGLFVCNVAVARPVSAYWFPLVAVQTVSATAAAFTAAFVYRLLSRVHGRRVGVAAGAGAFLATPVGFWATLPKRHSLVALLAVLTLYCFYRSREATDERGATAFRALSYVWVGLTAWVVSANALVLLAVLVPVDLLTARTNRPRSLAVVAGAFLVSLAPFFLTNALIAGNPLEPPRMLPRYRGGLFEGGVAVDGSSAVGSGESSTDPVGVGSEGRPADRIPFSDALGESAALLVAVFDRFVDPLVRGLEILRTDPERVWRVLVRSGYVERLAVSDDAPVNLTVLESMPLLGALVAAPVALWRRARTRTARRPTRRRGAGSIRPERATDVLAASYVLLHVAFYLPKLPLHHMLTMRYLHPAYPLCLYLLARFGPVRRAIDGRPRLLARSYLVGLTVGLPAYVAVLESMSAVQGEAVQLYALWALAAALCLGAWAVSSTLAGGFERAGAICLGVAGAATTAYLLVSGLGLLARTDQFALPASRLLAGSLRFLHPWW